jgi:hypothetical protein
LKILRVMAWVFWILLAAWAAVGLRHLRVSNSLEAWMPDLATPGPYRSYLVVGFPTSRADPATVAAHLRQMPEVAFCIDPVTVRATAWLTKLSAEDFLVSRDGSYSGVFCFARDGVDPHLFLKDVQAALTELAPSDVFAIGGPTAFQCAMDEWSQDRLPLILTAIVSAGGVMLLAVTGSLRISATAIAAIVLSQVIFMGAVCRMGIPLDMSLALVPPMMTAMGFSYAAHRALRRNSVAVLITCGLAAAVGIASYATADLKPVRHFALAGVPGLLLVWLIVVTLVFPDAHARRRRVGWMRTCRNLAFAINMRYRPMIVISGVALTAVGVCLAPFLRVESNPLQFFPSHSKIARDFDTLNRRLTGMLPSQVVVGDRNADAASMLAATPGMRKVLDITPWVGGSGRTFLCLADNDAVESLARRVPAWQLWADRHRTTLSWHGVAAQIHRSGTSIRKLAMESVPSMAMLMGALVLLLFRRWRLALLAAWITLVPIGMLIVVAVLSLWRLDPITLVIGSITTGVVVDDMLHLLSTYQRRRSMRRAMIECWKPCVGSSLAAAVCFALFTLSRFGPTAQFGLLMALATIFAMLTNQLLLQAVITNHRQSLKEKNRMWATSCPHLINGDLPRR